MVFNTEKTKQSDSSAKEDSQKAEQKALEAQLLLNDQSFDYMFKILLIGNSAVGKTSFLFRYCDDSFTSAFVSTVGIDFKVKTITRNHKKVKLQIWDTAGHERYRTITTAYYRGAMGFILMYDVTHEESFNAVQDWATQIRAYSSDNVQVLLVGNKCDLNERRKVSSQRGASLASALNFEFFETSVKENLNVLESFDRLVDLICAQAASSRHGGSSKLVTGDPLAFDNGVTRIGDGAERTLSSTCAGVTNTDNENHNNDARQSGSSCFCVN